METDNKNSANNMEKSIKKETENGSGAGGASDKKNFMLTEPVSSVIPKMAIPTIVAMLISSIYGLGDTFFVSSLGTNATAAVSVNFSLDQFIMMAGSFFGVGAASYISRLLGAKDEEQSERVLSVAFFLCLFIGAAIALLGFIFMTPMVRFLGATPSSQEYSIQYATYVLMVAPLMTCNYVLNSCLRAEGSATYSMVGMGAGGIINLILDPIFIFRLNLGVLGASMATAISKVISFSILVSPYLIGRTRLRIKLRSFRPDRIILGQIVAIGASSFCRTGLGVISNIIMNKLAGGISDSVLAGIGVCNRVMMFPFSILLGFGMGFQPVAGFNWGAGRFDRVKEAFRFATSVVIVGGGLMGLAVFIFAIQIIGFFTTGDAEMVSIGALAIRLQCVTLLIHGWAMICDMLHAGLGMAREAFFISTARQGTCFIPVIFPLTYLFGKYGVAATPALADVLTLLITVPLAIRITRIINEKWRLQNEIS